MSRFLFRSAYQCQAADVAAEHLSWMPVATVAVSSTVVLASAAELSLTVELPSAVPLSLAEDVLAETAVAEAPVVAANKPNLTTASRRRSSGKRLC